MKGNCNSGCFEANLGDSFCDMACDVEECGYDNGDCGCADGCTFAEIGMCKPECLVANCGYDPMCWDQNQRDFAFFMQMLERNIDFLPNFNSCLDKTPCPDQAALFDPMCTQECNNYDCAYNMGNCFNDPMSDCMMSGCDRCFGPSRLTLKVRFLESMKIRPSFTRLLLNWQLSITKVRNRLR